MNRKVLAYSLVVGLILCIPAYAARNAGAGKGKRAGAQQQNGDAQGFGAGRGQGMRDSQAALQELGVTDEQKTKIQTILKNYRASIMEIMKSTDTPAQKAEKIKPLRKDALGAIKAVLTAEQFKKAQKAKLFDRLFGDANPGMKLMRILQQLDLTDAQKADMKVIVQDQMKQTKAIRENASLTLEQKREAIRPIRKATEEKIKALLTQEQKDKLKELMKKQPRKQIPAEKS